MSNQFFKDVETIEELKKEYKQLAFVHHPDRPWGNLEIMQEINAQYELKFKSLSTSEESFGEFIEIMSSIVNLEGIEIEICGKWLWVSGNTYAYKDVLKKNGFLWASKKQMWYWRKEEDRATNKKALSIDKIRELHGSKKVKNKILLGV